MTDQVRRWVLADLTGVLPDYTFHINPNQMDSPIPPRNIQILGQGIDGQVRGLMQRQTHDWSFSGVGRDLAQSDALTAWVKVAGKTELTDHFGRLYVVRLKEFKPVRAGRASAPNRFTYTVKVTTYLGVMTP